MAFLTEISQWENGIYRLELSDPVEGGENGKSNAPLKHLANRTKKIYDVLAANGIFINLGEQTFVGQPVISNAVFNGNVSNGDVVYYNTINSRFEKAIADGTEKENAIGMADITNSKVVTSGLVQTDFEGVNGGIIYLSGDFAGAITQTSTTKAIGQFLYNGIIVLAIAAASTASAASIEPGSITPSMLQESYYPRSTIDTKCTNWDTAHTDRFKWNGGSTGLVPATGRSSLELGTIATQNADNVNISGGTIASAKLVIPLAQPAVLENGAIWIA